MKTKVCRVCGIEKATKEFELKKTKYSIVLSYRCNSCKKLYAKNYYEKNKDTIIKRRINHNRDKNKRREWFKQWEKRKLKSDIKFRIIKNIRIRHWMYLKGRMSTTKNLGCTPQELVEYIESLFKYGMTWDNYGYGKSKWCIDHKIPLSLIEINSEGNVLQNEFNLKLLHYTNMQPMWFIENMTKGNKHLGSVAIQEYPVHGSEGSVSTSPEVG